MKTTQAYCCGASPEEWLQAKQILQRVKDSGAELVFTNGCFDLLHLGHFTYLQAARELGDFLVVGLNSDASIKRLKGEQRPYNDLNTRLIALSSLRYVDMVVVFEEDTPAALIETLLPDILVKGGDYRKEDIVGADTVLKQGGRVELIDFVNGYSSTLTLGRIEAGSGTNVNAG